MRNYIVIIVGVLLIIFIAALSSKTKAATVNPDGTMVLSLEEINHCESGGGCKLITEHQINVLSGYIEQLKKQIEENKKINCI